MRETNGQQVKHLYILYERETGIISRDAKIESEVLYVGVIFEKKHLKTLHQRERVKIIITTDPISVRERDRSHLHALYLR